MTGAFVYGGAADFEGKKPNQSSAAGEFDSERRSKGAQMKNPATLKELPDYERSGLRSDVAESKGFDLRCGAGRLGLQSAPGALLRALGFESQRFLLYAKAPAYDGSFCIWKRYRVLIEKRLGGCTVCSGGCISI